MKLAGTWASGLPGGSEVDVILRDGCLDIRGQDGRSRTFKVGTQGLGLANVPAQTQAGATTGVESVPLCEQGQAKALHGQDASFGCDYGGQSIFRFFDGAQVLFLDRNGRPLELATRATRRQRTERKRLARARRALANFDADAHAASAVSWLLDRWRHDDRTFRGGFGWLILVSGVLPWEPVVRGNWRFSTFYEDGRSSGSRFFGAIHGRTIITFFGPWLCLRDLDGTLLGWRDWGGLGFDVRRLSRIRAETLHAVSLRALRPGRLGRIEVSMGSFVWRLAIPPSHVEVKPDRAAVVAIKPPHGDPTFTLHLVQDGREQIVPLTWRARRLAPALRSRLDAMPEGVRYVVHRPLLRRLVRLLQPSLLDRALAGLSTLPALRDELATVGPLGKAVAHALVAACQALLHVLVHVVRTCSPDPDSADDVVRALCLLMDFEGLVAMAAMARDVLVGPQPQRECEVGTQGQVRDRTGGFLRGWIEVGGGPFPGDGMVLVQLDYREIAFATMGLHGTFTRNGQLPPTGHDLAEMSWSDAVRTLRNDPDLARRLEDARDRAGGNAERRLVIGRTRDSVVIGVECLLYDLEQRAVVRWLHRNGLAPGVEADSSGLRFNVGPCFDDLAQLQARAATPPSGS